MEVNLSLKELKTLKTNKIGGDILIGGMYVSSMLRRNREEADRKRRQKKLEEQKQNKEINKKNQ